MYGTREGNGDVVGRLATDAAASGEDVRVVSGAFERADCGAFFFGASGTPITTYVMSTNTGGGIGSMVNGHGDMGRTPCYTRTDLLLSHEIGVMGSEKVRFELNVLDASTRRPRRDIFNGLNRGTGAGGARQSAAIDLSGTDLTKGYRLQRVDPGDAGRRGASTRLRESRLFQDGRRAALTRRCGSCSDRRQSAVGSRQSAAT